MLTSGLTASPYPVYLLYPPDPRGARPSKHTSMQYASPEDRKQQEHVLSEQRRHYAVANSLKEQVATEDFVDDTSNNSPDKPRSSEVTHASGGVSYQGGADSAIAIKSLPKKSARHSDAPESYNTKEAKKPHGQARGLTVSERSHLPNGGVNGQRSWPTEGNRDSTRCQRCRGSEIVFDINNVCANCTSEEAGASVVVSFSPHEAA